MSLRPEGTSARSTVMLRAPIGRLHSAFNGVDRPLAHSGIARSAAISGKKPRWGV